MTEVQARQILGITRSASRQKVQLAYEDKRRQLQRRLAPGMPVAVRQQAINDLTEIASAGEVLRVLSRNHARPTKPPQSRPRPPQVPTGTATTPQTLGEAWDLVVSALPFSRPVNVVVVAVSLVLLILISAIVIFGR